MRSFGLVRAMLIAVLVTSFAFALSVKEILESNLRFATDVKTDFEGLGSEAANAAGALAVANAGLQGVLNALNQELPELQQRLSNTQDQHVRAILEEKQRILNNLNLDLIAASSADSSFTVEMQDLANMMVGQANAATTFGNCVRGLLFLPDEPLSTPYFFLPPSVPSIPPPSSGDLATYIEENQDLIDAADAAIGDQKPPKEGEMPDKVDAFNAASKVVGKIKKAKENETKNVIKEIEKLVKEMKALGDPVDPKLTTKLECLLELLFAIEGIDTSDAESARALDKTAIERAHDAVKKAADAMDLVRRAV
jgi:hypothetical protein